MTKEKLNEIAGKLKLAPCPRCKSKDHHVVNNYGAVELLAEPKAGPQRKLMLCAVVICDGCGAVTMHDLETLGIAS